MDNNVDLLKIKIDKAREGLPEESLNAIDAVDWKAEILRMRTDKGYSYTQLEDLEIETELLLCGLINPEEYPNELEKRMGIPRPEVEVLVKEINEKIFKKIREELVKNIDRKKVATNGNIATGKENISEEEQILESREEILQKIENPEPTKIIKNIENEEFNSLVKEVDLFAEKELPAGKTENTNTKEESDTTNTPTNSILSQKFSGSFQIGTKETNHTLENITKNSNEDKKKIGIPKVDPYRELPE